MSPDTGQDIRICPWKYGKRWVYSITYDEALADLHRFAVPLHEEFAIPGHVELLVGQMGEIRETGNSSYNGMRHMNAQELRDLLARGWGVGNHSWSHQVITPEMVEEEIGRAKQVLEEAIGEPIIFYCSPGDNTNMADHVLAACRSYGYLGAMSLTDALNRPEDELFWINRTALHEQYYAPFFSAYDPFRNIRQAQAVQGWLIDYCHCPLETAIHPNKDCTQAQLRQRFETVLAEGGDDVWCAVPEEALSYHLMRRTARIETVGGADGERCYKIGLTGLPEQVPDRTLSFEMTVPAAWCRDPRVDVDGQVLVAELVRPGVLRVTCAVTDGTVIRVGQR
ncbi:MAG: polysaccharide deacetylase family protein [Gemmatimonadetes bacterium]|jgi:hypothetical protein|nr:polysaccharide deacetylase family protein [Gemmatimonadota bacterium]MBT5058802.1 polysaccharide deacetylase family protein [Gemmatimonadota bacterium]MBT5145990.1 polysaccharide deacetylase family protein [Gemmatimonadota bacterium]MBT5588165.1 polysaccharide deacetylase family protein [Gemmatimonadota bacterium]MBT5961606.1 polysaccharide deacetylase family protein [Gemmatimonadota bacterium]